MVPVICKLENQEQKTYLVQVLDIVHDDSSQNSRTVKLQEKEVKTCKARLIEDCVLQNLFRPKVRENVSGFSPTLPSIKGKT